MDSRHQLDWIRQNILQHLSRVDRVLALLVPAAPEYVERFGDESSLRRLFEKRHDLQVTLRQVERQIERRSLHPWTHFQA